MGYLDDPIIPVAASPAPVQASAWGANDPIVGGSDAAIRSSVQGALKGRRKTYDFAESFLAGLQNSVPALALSNPGSELADDPTVGGRLGYQAGQLAGDFPVMVGGAIMGAGAGTAAAPGPGTVIGGMAGAFGLPAGLRATLMDAYDKGEFKDFGDFWGRASHIVWETVKGQVTGAATSVAGLGVAGRVGGPTMMVANPASKLVQSVAPTAAELATMTTVGAALEGRVPSAQEFLDGAIILGGMKGATATAAKLRAVYKETGVRPAQVVADAAKDPAVALDLKPVETPDKSEPMVTVYHGSPHEFTQFDAAKIGTGEGAQAYGHGLYFADVPGVAAGYKAKTSYVDQVKQFRKELPDDATFEELADSAKAGTFSPKANAVLEALAKDDWLGFDYPSQAISAAFRHLKDFPDASQALKDAVENYGNLYKVEIPQRVVDMMLDWDKPLKDQSPEVQDAIRTFVPKTNFTGQAFDAWEVLTGKDIAIPSDPALREDRAYVLQKLGVTGVRYLDGSSRDAGKGTYNYVLFDPQHARIIERNGERTIPPQYEAIATADRLRSAVPDARIDPERALKIQSVIDKPMAEVPVTKEPNHINYKFIQSPDDVKAIHAKVAEVFSAEIEAARGKETWDQTAEKANAILRDAAKRGDEDAVALLASSGGDAMSTAPFRNLAARIMAKNAMDQKTAFDIRDAAADLQRAMGTADQEAATKRLGAAIETSALVHADMQKDAAEVARALNALKAVKQTGNLVAAIAEVQAKYGKDPEVLARLILKLTDPEQINKFGREAAKATTLEKVIEAWKAGLLSGPWTHAANLVGNTTMLALRPLVDAVAASIGVFRPGDAVNWREPFARVYGNYKAIADAAHVVQSAYESGGFSGVREVAAEAVAKSKLGPKGEMHRQANEGAVGAVVSVPFHLLSAVDLMFKTMNERGEAYTLSIRQALAEGIDPRTREFGERIAELLDNPTKEMQAKIEDAGVRFTFNKELGEAGKAIQHFAQAAPAFQFIAPFIRTPINIFKELQKLTPLAPLLKEWREAFNAGGAEQAKAIAELSIGSSLMGTVFMYALDGTITGQGDPDPGKRRVQMASGWQPYSIKVDGKYYSYQRIQPLGTLMGLAADAATVIDQMDKEEAGQIAKVLSVAFANAVTNQTFLQGITQIVQVMNEPGRYGPKIAQNYAGTVVPALLSQTAQMHDPLQREVNSMIDAIRSRIPGVREDLAPKLDAFGMPIEAKGKLGFVFPIQVSEKSTDPVRVEAERLGISVAAPPKKMHFGAHTGKIGDVKLTPEQTHKFNEVAGNTAHDIMDRVIASPSWAVMPDIAKRMTFQRAELVSHKAGALAALPPDERGPIMQEISNKLILELQKIHSAPGAMQ